MCIFQNHTIHAKRQNGTRVYLVDELIDKTFYANDDSDDLDASSRTTSAGADSHDYNCRHPEGRSPGDIVEFFC